MRSVLLVAAVVLVSATALIRAYAELDEDFLAEWAGAHGLVITERNRPMVRWYLRNARVLRTWGALAGFFLPMLAEAAFESSGSMPLVWVFVGYLLGALYAEVSLVRPFPTGRRAATLVPRALGDYLPRELRITQRCLGVAIAVASLALVVVPFDPASGLAPEPGLLLLGLVGGPASAIGLERLQGWLVRRPQPFTDRTLIAADDAIRAQSVHSVSGSGIDVALVWLSILALQLGTPDVQFLRWTTWVVGLFGFGAALFACQYYGHRAWRVRRHLPVSTERSATA